ncbi:MAG: hypothetical protein JWM95_5304 [Gemmatimonadetes bacterium]|nr:hypothetical protein [Gemmatimonadota bacterium]
MPILRFALLAPAALVLAACGPNAEHKQSDSTAAVVSTQRLQLSTQLAAQKDSLTRVVLEADEFITHIDSSMSKVKGLPKEKKSNQQLDPLARQIGNRKLLMARVDALVQRARATSAQLAKSNGANTELRAQLASDSAMITDLSTTIKRQTAAINALSLSVDSLKGSTMQLASTLASTKTELSSTQSNLQAVETERNTMYYVVGKEDDLVKKGVVVREGGTNLGFAHPGRTLQIARMPDPAAFTPIDARTVQTITMPDSTHRYRIVSRQSLDNATVVEREKDSFKGDLTIADAGRFWAPSRYLVIVQH